MANDRELVLMHLQEYGSITPDEAKAEYGCARLASRICELRENGYAIKTEMVSCRNRRGRVSNFAKYSLEVEQ